MRVSEAHRYRQIEAAECGLACLALSAAMLGSKSDLSVLRQQHPISSRGATLSELIEVARSMGLTTRAVRCEVDELPKLRKPSILHWGLNHFVVLIEAGRRGVKVFDPALGYRRVTDRELAEGFTGVALEIASTPGFARKRQPSPLNLYSLFQWTPAVRATLIQVLVLSGLMQLYIIASPFYLQVLVDDVIPKGDTEFLTSLALGFALLAVFNAGAEFLRGTAAQRASSLLSWDMTQRMFHHLIRLPLPWFQRRRLADVLSRFQSLDPVKSLIANGLISALIDGLLGISTALMMWLFSPPLAMVALFGLVTYTSVRLLGLPYTRRLASDSLLATISEQGKRIETLRGIQTIKAMGAENYHEGAWANRFANTIKTAQASALATLGFATIQKLIDALTNVLIIYLGIRQVIAGESTVGLLYAFLAYRSQFMVRAVSLTEQVVNWRMLEVYTLRLADVVLTPVENGIDRSPVGAPKMIGGLELDGVSFRYGPTDPFVFRDISFGVKPGEFIALTGPSGCGKSSLLKVLCGLYEATAGEIRIDGLPMSSWGPRWIRSNLGVVMQDDDLFQGSIVGNIVGFREEYDLPWVHECLRMASLDEDVGRMPMGTDSLVGDMGSNLSGGQKQRLLLARALFNRPALLLLDEPTSSIDSARELEIFRALASLKITRIVVSHNPASLGLADRVINFAMQDPLRPR